MNQLKLRCELFDRHLQRKKQQSSLACDRLNACVRIINNCTDFHTKMVWRHLLCIYKRRCTILVGELQHLRIELDRLELDVRTL